MANIQISTVGVKKSLQKYKPLKALVEYIWNGFDAKANFVSVNCGLNKLGGIETISVTDNGYGIPKSELKRKFMPFFESEKLIDPDERRKLSAIHGKNGVGRLTFFKFSCIAKWSTVFEMNDNKFKYDIIIDETNLEEYKETEVVATGEPIGTKVTFYNIRDIICVEEIKQYIIEEFSWFLELNKNRGYKIILNNEEINYEDIVSFRELATLGYNARNIGFDVKYVIWDKRLNTEYSCYYFINSKDEEVLKETTSLNNKGDKFYHSVYIKSQIFDNFFDNKDEVQLPLIGYSKASDEFKFIRSEVDKELKKLRRPFIKQYTDVLISELETAKAFPEYDNNNFIDKIKRTELETVVKELYKVQPKIFLNLNIEQKKTMVRLLDLIMQSGEVESLLKILGEIVDLDSEEREELSSLLTKTSMSNVIKTIKLIEDRYKAVEELKQLVFNKELKANEVYHLQNFIERHYWLFGEQYHLVTAAEPDFEEALRRYIYILEGVDERVVINHPDKNKEMDIFAVRQDISSKGYSNIVVELKHPNINLGSKQLNQVKTYMEVILRQERFNAPNMEWEFYLIGNRFDSTNYIQNELKNNLFHGEKSLVFKIDRCKIYVKTWSEIFAEFEMKHKYLNEKLQLERFKLLNKDISADDIISNLEFNSAIQSAEIVLS